MNELRALGVALAVTALFGATLFGLGTAYSAYFYRRGVAVNAPHAQCEILLHDEPTWAFGRCLDTQLNVVCYFGAGDGVACIPASAITVTP